MDRMRVLFHLDEEKERAGLTSGIIVFSGIMAKLVALLTKSAGWKKNLWAFANSLDVAPGTNGNACSFLGKLSFLISGLEDMAASVAFSVFNEPFLRSCDDL